MEKRETRSMYIGSSIMLMLHAHMIPRGPVCERSKRMTSLHINPRPIRALIGHPNGEASNKTRDIVGGVSNRLQS